MNHPTLDYARRPEFDTGQFVARHLQVLGWLSIAWMIARPIVLGGVHIDLSCVFFFWAAKALKKRSHIARNLVLVFGGVVLVACAYWACIILMFASPTGGTSGRFVSWGDIPEPDPPFWPNLIGSGLGFLVVAIPVVTLLSPLSRRQFAGQPAEDSHSAYHDDCT